MSSDFPLVGATAAPIPVGGSKDASFRSEKTGLLADDGRQRRPMWLETVPFRVGAIALRPSPWSSGAHRTNLITNA
jgi:hypothetical protein